MRFRSAPTFRAKFLGREVLEIMKDDTFMEGGNSEVIAIRLWEEELMIRLRVTEEEYIQIPKMERARKIIAMKLSGWFEILEYQIMRQEWEEERRTKGRK